MKKSKSIPQIAYISQALIRGEVLTIMDGFKRFNCTNLPRELSRSVERKFGVEISRERVEFTTDCDMPGFFFRYRLNATAYNEPGIKKMRDYINEYMPERKDVTLLSQTALF